MSIGDLCNLRVGDFPSVMSVDHYGHGIGDTDGISDLNFRTVCKSRGDDVLCNVPGGICT